MKALTHRKVKSSDDEDCLGLFGEKVGNEWEDGEGRELSERRGGKRYSVSSALRSNWDSRTASFRPHLSARVYASSYRVRSDELAGAMTANNEERVDGYVDIIKRSSHPNLALLKRGGQA